MPLLRKYKSIFIHIPKCGGSSVESVLFPEEDRLPNNLWMGIGLGKNPEYCLSGLGFRNQYGITGGLQHLPAKTIKRVVDKNLFDSYFKFCFVRNPYERAVSQFFYSKNFRSDLCEWIDLPQNGEFSFTDYLNAIISSPTHVQFQPQCDFIFEGPNLLVDFVGRVDNFQEDFDFICNMIDIPSKKIPHANKSNNLHYRDMYSLSDKRLVEKIYECDIDFLKYSF
tara:strand:- start:343 stop:1014 length:672 start_codon:yes stop_codon:yes gene_type:complete